MKNTFLTALAVTALACASAFYLFPDTIDHLGLAVAFAILIPQLVAMWAFLTSLRAFKKGLRRAYYILTAGILLFSINQLQIWVISFVVIDPVLFSWAVSGITFAGALLMCLSMHTFARLLELKVRLWGSLPLIIGLAVVLALGAAFIPHSPTEYSERVIDGVFGLYVAAGAFAAAASVLAWRIKERLSASYKPAMGWLTLAMALLAFGCFHETLVKLLPLFEKEQLLWYMTYSVSLWPLVGVAILLLGASLSFKQINKELTALPESAGYVDVITYAAQLVSDPKAIDIALDKVRQLTARKGAEAEITPDEQDALLKVYKEIETYLITNEPLVKITKEELRARLPEAFRQRL